MPGEYRYLVGVGGIGSGMFFALRGRHTLGRNESRAGTMLHRRDFCKLHIVAHYVAVLMGARQGHLAAFPIGKVGDDAAGSAMVEHMRRAGMDTRFVGVDPEASTLFSVCFTYPDGEGGNITTDDSASARVLPADVDAAVGALEEEGLLEGARGLALAAPEVPLAARTRLLEWARGRGWLAAAAVTTGEVPRATEGGMFALADLLSVNREEAAGIAAMDPKDPIEAIAGAAGQSLSRINPKIHLCVTAGADGAWGWADGAMEHTPAPKVRVVNTAGAGDATLAGLMVAAAAGLPFIKPERPKRGTLGEAPLETALDFAALLAGLAVMSEDTISFDADAAALCRLAGELGADVSALRPALRRG